MSFPFVVLDHMANNQRTYQWVNGRIQGVEAMQEKRRLRPVMGIQTALLVFTLSSVTLLFAGGTLAFALVVLYSIFFG